MHSAGLELTKLTYTRPEDNLIRYRGDRSTTVVVAVLTLTRIIKSVVTGQAPVTLERLLFNTGCNNVAMRWSADRTSKT